MLILLHPGWIRESLPGGLASAAPRQAARAPAPPAPVDEAELLDRPIATLEIIGLRRVDEASLRTNLRVAPGQPYDPTAVRADVSTMYRLGQFQTVAADARLLPDGTVALRYVVNEQALITTVQVVGNKVVSDEQIRAVIPLFANAPRDDFLVEQSIRDIKNLYRQRGHFLVEVTVDESRLADSGILIFRIVEGPRVRIRAVEFEGNDSFASKVLGAQIRTKPYIFLFRKGQLDEDQLLDDVATLDRYYRDRGFVDVRVDRRVDISADNTEAKVVFVIAEGRRYRVRRIDIFGGSALDPRPLRVFAPEQLRAMLEIQPGDVLSQDLVRKSARVIEDSYGLLGYIETRVGTTSVRTGEAAEVDLLIDVREGSPTRTGIVRIQGNFLTKDKVIRRELRMPPGRPLDARQLTEAQTRLRQTRLFGEPIRIAVQDPAPDEEIDPEDLADGVEVRDVLVEVRERNTGSVNFGFLVGTDSGLAGEIAIRQDNFDIADWPDSWGELFGGRAFRGAGQRFQLSIAPGIDVSTFGFSITEPSLLETDLSMTVGSFFRFRNYDYYDEQRFNANTNFGLRIGDLWGLNAGARIERVKLVSIDADAPVQAFDQAGPDWLTAVSLRLSRRDVDRPMRPSRGTIFDLVFDQVGAFGGDWNYSMVRGEFTAFFLIDEDFLGRRSVLRTNVQAGYFFDDAPIYESFYLGGRSLRGFDFRTVSPKGINRFGQQTNDPIGGSWLFFAGAQYEFPIFGEMVNGVFFVDSGTVTDDIALDPYRVSIGAGLRLYIPQFGPIPLAFDLAWPISKAALDEEQIFSFSAELPF
ncbi:MAG TPA: outer membrane protein assembly factor BamA [Phycisphaerales bacterium]|nr:outer membrane protein assembly factor BamA [Phycisphaerales bacterium]